MIRIKKFQPMSKASRLSQRILEHIKGLSETVTTWQIAKQFKVERRNATWMLQKLREGGHIVCAEKGIGGLEARPAKWVASQK